MDVLPSVASLARDMGTVIDREARPLPLIAIVRQVSLLTAEIQGAIREVRPFQTRVFGQRR